MFNHWVANILGVIVLGVLVDMIMPSGNTKTYTRFFLGLLTILVIIQPISNAFNGFSEYLNKFWSLEVNPKLETMNYERDNMEMDQKKYLVDIYKGRLEEDIRKRARGFIDDESISVNIELKDINEEEFYEIDSIYLYLGLTTDFIIEPVEIAIDSGGQVKQNPQLQEDILNQDNNYSSLKKHLSSAYEIEESRIYIYKD